MVLRQPRQVSSGNVGNALRRALARRAALTQAKALLALGRKHGYARDDLIDIIQSIG
jgi:hypothetical protein